MSLLDREGSVEDDDSGIVFRDLMTVMCAGFACIAVLLLAHINPKAEAAKVKDTSAPGNVLVDINWPPELDSDVDLWVQAPGDVPVGYSNKGGAVFNLLRDDLGRMLDLSGINYENAYSRGIVPGEYTVNAHLYRNRAAVSNIPVTVVVSTKAKASDTARQILMSKVNLTREGEERTVFRFKLTEAGAIVPGSVNSLPKQLRVPVQSPAGAPVK